MLHACIAKYKEDLAWTSELPCTYTIYDKSKDIPNKGREAETYLRYIIENYDSLPEYTVFLQGNPFDHINNRLWFHVMLNNIINGYTLSNSIGLNNILYELPNTWTRTEKSYKALFNTDVPSTFNFSPGAQYIVPRHCIRARSIDFYKLIREVMVDKNELTHSHTNCLVCPWTIERMWPYIFDPSTPLNTFTYNDLL